MRPLSVCALTEGEGEPSVLGFLGGGGPLKRAMPSPRFKNRNLCFPLPDADEGPLPSMVAEAVVDAAAAAVTADLAVVVGLEDGANVDDSDEEETVNGGDGGRQDDCCCCCCCSCCCPCCCRV